MSSLSDFWLTEYDEWDFIDDARRDEENTNDDNSIIDNDRQSDHTRQLIKLSSARRAIANYVSILTNKNIPVSFNDSNINCTDGTEVHISSDINKRDNFDVAVGLALHEASHIKYSDFELFKTLWMKIPRSIYDITEPLNIKKDDVALFCKDLLNYVEDRFIDYTVHANAPGYRGYYEALYDKYFNAKVITEALESDLYKVPSAESYMFRIINFTNPNTDLKALPGLVEIARKLDLSNIKRLTTPQDRLNVALDIAEIVFKNINEYNYESKVSSAGGTAGDGSGNGSDVNKDDANNVGSSTVSIDDLLGGQSSEAIQEDNPVVDNIGQDSSISKAKIERIKKAFAKQKDFLKGSIKKKKVSRRDKNVLDTLEKSKVELVDVAHDLVKRHNLSGAVECILVKNMTRELLFSDECPMFVNDSSGELVKMNTNIVNEGIILGTKIGRRLQVRNEVNTHKFSRRYTGKLDKRLIHELGFSDENIFYTTVTEKYKKINFHVSVDASSSMRGKKWHRALRMCVALAKAASMLDNVHLTISFRTTTYRNPYILIAYDSKVDKFSKIRNLFPYLDCTGVTPEGLCYEAIMKYLPVADNDTNSYFVNLSDGEPYFHYTGDGSSLFSYNGPEAAKHTQTQVKKIRNNGYNVISYFIYDYMNPDSKNLFGVMYGNDANYINTESFVQITNTLNKKMMESVDI